ncbi:hypothetical protein [Roseivirga pacifica]|uniref:hypothetical protein n=1 Tax=Roseivirga pacifica TaxID=1267423 RepID=UPI003BAC4557
MRALAFIDLLGFSAMVSNDKRLATEILDDFYNISFSHIKNEHDIHGDLFSDSLVAHSSSPAILVNTIAKIYRDCLRKNDSYTQPLGKFFLLPRGGISFGHVDIQSRTESPNLTKNFIVSPALVHSVKMESQVKGSRLLIADLDNGNQQVFNWNNEVKSILFENSNFTFWSTFKYYDALWFLDLAKSSSEQKTEVTYLIEVAEKLVHSNHKNKSARDQHVQTLRIGLLSFSKFLTPNDNPLLYRFLEDYRDDLYWLVWLTLIEMIMNSPDSWALPSKREVIEFYKEVSLKPGWAKVISEINKPKNEYILGSFREFLSEMNI